MLNNTMDNTMQKDDQSTVVANLLKSVTGDESPQEDINASALIATINRMAVDMATIKAFMREMRTEITLQSSQIKYFTQLTETIAEEEPIKNQIGTDALEAANKYLQSSPLSKHPMFKEMIEPLQDMINKTKA